MKYIDAEKIKEKIDKIRQNWIGESTGLEVGEFGAELGAAESILDSIDDIIVSLQQEKPDVDLKKFISDFIDKKDSQNQGKWCEEDIIEAMKSSFDRGLNARNQ